MGKWANFIGFLAAGYTLYNSMYYLKEGESGLVWNFFKGPRVVEEEGLHLKNPFFESVYRVPSNQLEIREFTDEDIVQAEKEMIDFLTNTFSFGDRRIEKGWEGCGFRRQCHYRKAPKENKNGFKTIDIKFHNHKENSEVIDDTIVNKNNSTNNTFVNNVKIDKIDVPIVQRRKEQEIEIKGLKDSNATYNSSPTFSNLMEISPSTSTSNSSWISSLIHRIN